MAVVAALFLAGRVEGVLLVVTRIVVGVLCALACGMAVVWVPSLWSAAHYRLFVKRKLEKTKPKKGDVPPPKKSDVWKPYIRFARREDTRQVVVRKARAADEKKGREAREPVTLNIEYRRFWPLVQAVMAVLGAVFGALYVWVPVVILILLCGPLLHRLMVSSVKAIVDGRERLLVRMFEVSAPRLGLKSGGFKEYGECIEVLAWRDPLKPKEIKFSLPPAYSFDVYEEENFLRTFNGAFGRELAWVEKGGVDEDTKRPLGWNPDEGTVTITSLPPLPMMAPLRVDHILGDDIPWTFIPLGLGVEGGVTTHNPETGEEEHVIGYSWHDSGAKEKIKQGVQIDEHAANAAPMCLIAGSTGSGKAIPVDEDVLVLVDGPELSGGHVDDLGLYSSALDDGQLSARGAGHPAMAAPVYRVKKRNRR